jgi:type II secretory pathway pseudopilin PulG
MTFFTSHKIELVSERAQLRKVRGEMKFLTEPYMAYGEEKTEISRNLFSFGGEKVTDSENIVAYAPYFLATKKFSNCARSGFSLVEVMVYLAVLVLIAGALITTFLSLNTVLVRNKTERELTQAASVSMERIVRAIQSADSVNMGLSTLDTNASILTLTATPTTTQFYLTDDTLMMSEDGTEVGPLTSDSVSVQSFVANRFMGSTTEMVRVALTLSAQSNTSSSTRTFYTSAVVRGSYE